LPLNVTGTNIVLFADDTNLLITGENINTVQSSLNSVMQDIQTWFFSNSLIVNTGKTSAISFHTTQNKSPALPQVSLEERDIPFSTETKFLGIYIHENVKWTAHIKKSKLKVKYKPLYDKFTNEYNERTRPTDYIFRMLPRPPEIWSESMGRRPRK